MAFKGTVVCLLLISSIQFGVKQGLCQTPVQELKDLPVQLGTIRIQVKEFEAAPFPIRVLEVQVEITNPSQKLTVGPDLVKVTIIPKEIRFPSQGPKGDFSPPPEEVALTQPLLPRMVRILTFGFPLPKEKLESISFEVQINAPAGEKKTATFTF